MPAPYSRPVSRPASRRASRKTLDGKQQKTLTFSTPPSRGPTGINKSLGQVQSRSDGFLALLIRS